GKCWAVRTRTRKRRHPSRRGTTLKGVEMGWLNRLFGSKSAVDLRSDDERAIQRRAQARFTGADEATAQGLSKLATGPMESWEADRAEMRRIGEALNTRGGIQLMKAVCYRVGAICGKSRLVE